MPEEITEIVSNFKIKGKIKSVFSIVQGHINSTFRLVCDFNGKDILYALQAVNKNVFKNPELVMENISAVTSFLKKKINAVGGDANRETLNLVPTKDGGSFFIDENGEYWRIYDYISAATTYDTVQNPKHLYNAGYAFGRFQSLLADFPIETLHITIPDFHNTAKRLDDFFNGVKRDECGRVKDVLPEIELIAARRDKACLLLDMARRGELPIRVTHNDTKYNNIMIDDETGRALCVIDLDTVMPGLAAYDFGDAIRFAACSAPEDETDLSRVYLDMELYEQFTAGFVKATAGFLTNTEVSYLPWGAKIITLELASRFLLDHINGDRYFKIHRENHNLERARFQLALLLDMEKRFDEMCVIVKKYIKE